MPILLTSHLFFFYWTGPHRHLHSFPTRRSSDLGTVPSPNHAWPRGHAFSSDAIRSRSTTTAMSSQAQPQPRQVTDRKSTRLNSSHTVISYAVFCLKKKK